MTARKLYKFHGGIEVDDHKNISTQKPIQHIPIADTLIVPLRQHIGAPAKPIVKVGQSVKKYELIAQSATGGISSKIHAPSSGKITAIDQHPLIHRSGLSDTCIFIKTDGKDKALGEPKTDDYDKLSADEIFDKIQNSGIVGLGGAGFPSDIKALGGMKNQIKTLIINAVECEPYITCDDLLIRENAAKIIQGVQILKKLIAPQKTIIAIEDNKPEALAELKTASDHTDTEVVNIPTIYPSGGERQLIKILTNQDIPAGVILADIGFLTFNISTVYAIYNAVINNRPLIERVVTLTGNKCPGAGNYLIKIGTPVSHIFEHLNLSHDQKIICGGPMMGFEVQSIEAPTSKTTNCLIVLDNSFVNNKPVDPCIRCGKCVEVCPTNLLPQQLYWYCKDNDFNNAQSYNLAECMECNCCTHVCPSNIPIVDICRSAKTQIKNLNEKRKKSDAAKIRYDNRELRLERLKKERKEKQEKQRAAIKQRMAEKKAQAEKDEKAKLIKQAQEKTNRPPK